MKLSERLPGENARTYTFRVLLYNIINLELVPGSAISENELSVMMKLSRTPVREALIELNKLGLVDIFPQKGSFVTKIDYDVIEESRFMRLALEVAVLKLACEEGISPHHMDLLRENVKQQRRELLGSGNEMQMLALDNEFHRLLFLAVDRIRTYEVVHAQMVHFDRLRVLSMITIKSPKTVNDHENIVYALERRDSELAEMVMTRHLTRHRVERSEICKLHPDYFVQR